jgi:recombination protein U
MTTNITEIEIKNSLKALMRKEEIYFMKYPDSVRKFYRSPYDFLILTEQYNYAVEAKKTKRKSFPFKNITSHQIESLENFSALMKRNRSLVFINFRNAKRKASEKINNAYLIDIAAFTSVCGVMGRKSLPMDWCEEHAVRLARRRFETGYGWDLSILLNSNFFP